jgi:hypothetical protein
VFIFQNSKTKPEASKVNKVVTKLPELPDVLKRKTILTTNSYITNYNLEFLKCTLKS